MLIGKFPFDCDTDMQLLWQVLKGIKFPERPQLSPGVKDLIRSLTEPQPSQRATLQAILEHPWMQPAIKADPFFERDEEEAALNAEQARSMRSTLPPQHLDDDADVDDKHGKSSATTATAAATTTTTAAVATSSSKAQSHLASSATSTATAVSTSISSSSNSSSSSSVGGGGSGVGERADGSVAATTREASPTRAAPAPPTPSLPPPALPLKPTPLLSSSSSSSSTVEDVKKD
jgi:serine/threonine protein kinase